MGLERLRWRSFITYFQSGDKTQSTMYNVIKSLAASLASRGLENWEMNVHAGSGSLVDDGGLKYAFHDKETTVFSCADLHYGGFRGVGSGTAHFH